MTGIIFICQPVLYWIYGYMFIYVVYCDTVER
jgi:hypothetical protein